MSARHRVAVVLDVEAVNLLSPTRRFDPRRRSLIARLTDAGAVWTPLAARVEAAAPRDAVHADLNRLSSDLCADRSVADDAARLREETGASAVDCLVAAEAVAMGQREPVEVLTSDLDDFRRLAGARPGSFTPVRI